MIHLFLALAVITSSQAFETRRILLADRAIDALIERPKGQGPHPLLIIAPGRVLKMNDDLYKSLAEAAAKIGFVVIRFNWGAPKLTDLKQEAEDLSTVLSSFTQGRVNEPLEINVEQVVLFADGVSARIAMLPESDALKPSVKAQIFSNPECDAGNSFTKLYGKIASVKTPRLLITTRPENECELAQIYDQAKTFGDNFSLYTLSGNGTSRALTSVVLNALHGLNWERAPRGPRNDAEKVKKMTPHSHIGHSH